MASAVLTPSLSDEPLIIAQEQIDSLTATYQDCGQPIWVHDLWMRCVYRNRQANEAFSGNSNVSVSEIIDHNGRVVGHLTIGVN